MKTGLIIPVLTYSNFLVLVLFVISVNSMLASSPQYSTMHYGLMTNALPNETSIVSSIQVSSMLDCATSCLMESRENRCTIATYNKKLKSCTLTTATVTTLIYNSGSNDTVTLYPQKDQTAYVEGRSFTTAFMPNFAMSDVTLLLYIVPSSGDTTTQHSSVTVNAPYVSFSQTFTLTELLKVEIPVGVINETTDVGISNAVSVQSDKAVVVFAMNNSPFSSGGMLVLPDLSLSTSYLVAATPYDDLESRLVIIPSVYGERAVKVDVTFPDGTNVTATIQVGDTYQITRTGLSGTIVESDGDIAVLAGEWCANLPDPGNYSCDHIVEQMPPTETLDTLYIVAQAKPRTTYILNIAASKDNTIITLRNASDIAIYTTQLHSGETVSKTFADIPFMSVTADNPILVTQYGVSASVDGAVHGDSSMFVVSGVNRFMNKYSFMVPEGYDTNTVIIIYNITSVSTDPRSGLIHNNQSVYITEMTSVHVEKEEFGVCYLDLSDGVHYLENSVKFGAVLYGQKRLNEYAWNLGMYMRNG